VRSKSPWLFGKCEGRKSVDHYTAWESDRNVKQKGVDWQFTTADARIKLKRLYPRIQN